jgi:hypothetical protein
MIPSLFAALYLLADGSHLIARYHVARAKEHENLTLYFDRHML